MTEYRKQLKWWLFDIQTCSDLGTCGFVYQGQRQKEGGSFSFLTCSWHIQAEAPLSLPRLLLCTELQSVCSAKRHLQEVSLPTNFLFCIDEIKVSSLVVIYAVLKPALIICNSLCGSCKKQRSCPGVDKWFLEPEYSSADICCSLAWKYL